jgi:hypothetical protein
LAGVGSVAFLYWELPMTSAKRISAAKPGRAPNVSAKQVTSQTNDACKNVLMIFLSDGSPNRGVS